ncbi:MAG: hypothetical protein ABFD82_11100 [Syntrophaceae bacterium]
MKKWKTILGYTWAALAIIIAPVTYIGGSAISRALASATGVIVSPRYSGGEIVRTVNHGTYTTAVHRPVFDALIGQTKTGFIQVNWLPAAGLPPVITETVDFNGDGKADFTIVLNTKSGEASLADKAATVLSLEKTYHLRDGWAARINLQRKP